MIDEVPLLSRILLSMKILSEIELIELQTVLYQQLRANIEKRDAANPRQEYEITAQVALADLSITPLSKEIIEESLPKLNGAELSLVISALYSYLRCGDISDGTTASERAKNGLRSGGGMAPVRGPLRKEDQSIEAVSKKAEIYHTVQHEFDAGNKKKALMLLNQYIKLAEQANQPTFGLRLRREFMFFHQPGNYESIIALCEKSRIANIRLM